MSHATGARSLRDEDLDSQYRPAPRLRVVDGGAEPRAERRTVTITGRPEQVARRRPSRTEQRITARPDRVALWAVGMGVFMALMAAATANAAPL